MLRHPNIVTLYEPVVSQIRPILFTLSDEQKNLRELAHDVEIVGGAPVLDDSAGLHAADRDAAHLRGAAA